MFPFLIEPYERISKGCKPKEENEFTVCASIVAIHKTNSSLSHTIVLTTGTKSLNIDNDTTGYCLLSDSHAEVLCVRAFRRYLLKSYQIFQDNILNINQNTNKNAAMEWIKSSECIFELSGRQISQHDESYNSSRTQKLRLKNEWSIEMFISDPPCGDASIYPSNTHNKHNDKNIQREEEEEDVQGIQHQSNHTIVNFTGAKLLVTCDEGLSINREETGQCLSCIRLKPGRSDIPIERRSMSKSCSDKICKWSAVGLQGSFLSMFFEPIHISRVSVCRDPNATVLDQQNACLRALNHRFIDSQHNGIFGNRSDIVVEVIDVLPYMNENKSNGHLQGFGKSISQYLLKQSVVEAEANGITENNVVITKCDEPIVKRPRNQSFHSPLNSTTDLRPFGIAFNWIIDVAIDTSTGDAINSNMKHIRQCGDGTVESLQAHNGSLLGVTKGNKGKPEYSSRLCRRNFATLFSAVVNRSQSLSEFLKSRISDALFSSSVDIVEQDIPHHRQNDISNNMSNTTTDTNVYLSNSSSREVLTNTIIESYIVPPTANNTQHSYQQWKSHCARVSGYSTTLTQFKALSGFSQWDAYSSNKLTHMKDIRSSFPLDI